MCLGLLAVGGIAACIFAFTAFTHPAYWLASHSVRWSTPKPPLMGALRDYNLLTRSRRAWSTPCPQSWGFRWHSVGRALRHFVVIKIGKAWQMNRREHQSIHFHKEWKDRVTLLSWLLLIRHRGTLLSSPLCLLLGSNASIESVLPNSISELPFPFYHLKDYKGMSFNQEKDLWINISRSS
jgi:hypothetical protein